MDNQSGCIRLINEIGEDLYDQGAIGTPLAVLGRPGSPTVAARVQPQLWH